MNTFKRRSAEDSKLITDAMNSPLNEDEMKIARTLIRRNKPLHQVPCGNLFPYCVCPCTRIARHSNKTKDINVASLESSTQKDELHSAVVSNVRTMFQREQAIVGHVKHMLKLPKYMRENLIHSNGNLDKILEKYRAKYNGTDPITDAEDNYKK